MLVSIAWLLVASTCQAQSGTFIDRQQATDLRVVSYNVYFDTIFPEVNAAQAAKFERVLHALDPDILNLQEIYGGSISQVQSLLDTVAPLPNGESWNVRKGNDNIIASKYPFTPLTADLGGEVVALVDLPDDQFPSDFFFSNNHYKCCGNVGGWEDQSRQNQSDGIVRWLRDYRTPGGLVDLVPGTPFAALGDLNIIGGPGPLDTLITGDISNEARYGSDFPPDWDGSHLTDAHPYHNGELEFDYTWRDDNQIYDPGRLDFIIYSDSALDVGNQFILNTVDMSPSELAATGLQQFDITLDDAGAVYDHLPVVVDFRLFDFATSDFDFSRTVDGADLVTWQDSYGTASGTTRTLGDADGDGDVDGRDFLIWQRQHSVLHPMATTIPEPGALTMCLFSIAGLLLARWWAPPRRRGMQVCRPKN